MGGTEILAAAILKSETADQFEWAFLCFAKLFKKAPKNFFTDGDGEIAKAFAMVSATSVAGIDGLDSAPWAECEHRLCVFHLSKNFFQHIRPLFGDNSDGWHKAINMFWTIAKDTDESSKANFDMDWETLVQHVKDNTAETSAQELQLSWLQNLGEKARQFCARFVWSTITWGIHSTQRSESANSSVKAHSVRRVGIAELCELLDSHNADARERKAVEQQILRAKQKSMVGSSALLEFLEPKLTPYAFKLVLTQHIESSKYKSEQSDGISSDWIVTRRPTITNDANTTVSISLEDGSIVWTKSVAPQDVGEADGNQLQTNTPPPRRTSMDACSCQFPIAFGGLPCRHMCRVSAVQLQHDSAADFEPLLQNIDKKWLVRDKNETYKEVACLRSMPDPTSIAPRHRSAPGFSRKVSA